MFLKSCITINDNQLEFQESMKYLGIKIDRLLKFDEHVAYINNKIAKKELDLPDLDIPIIGFFEDAIKLFAKQFYNVSINTSN